MKMEIINCNEIINCYDKVLMDCIGSIPFHWNVIVIVHPIQFNCERKCYGKFTLPSHHKNVLAIIKMFNS